MPTVTYNGASYACTTAIKGDTYIRLLDAEDAVLASFEGVTDFSAFAISDGSWTSPEDLDQCCLVVMRRDGTLVKTTKKVCDVGDVTNLQSNKAAVTPTTSRQTIYPDSGYDAMTKVIVNAMPTGTLAKPSIQQPNSSGRVYVTAGVSTAGYLSTSEEEENYIDLPTQAAATITPGKEPKTAVAAGKYTTGAVVVAGDDNHSAANIKNGVTLFGLLGEYKGEWSFEQGIGYLDSDSNELVVDGITRVDPAVLIVISDFEWDSSTLYDYRYVVQMIYTRDCLLFNEHHWGVYSVAGLESNGDEWSDVMYESYKDSVYELSITDDSKLSIYIDTTGAIRFRRYVNYTVFAFYDS